MITIEYLPETNMLAACTCDDAIPQRLPSCSMCESSICALCGQCIANRRGWDVGWIEPDMLDQPVDRLLKRLREGHQWLCQDIEKFHSDPPSAAAGEVFGRMLALWDDLEVAVRHVHEYKGCVLGDGRECLAGGPVRCSACVSSPDETPRE